MSSAATLLNAMCASTHGALPLGNSPFDYADLMAIVPSIDGQLPHLAPRAKSATCGWGTHLNSKSL